MHPGETSGPDTNQVNAKIGLFAVTADMPLTFTTLRVPSCRLDVPL